jgi:hypothetical protein
MEDPSAVAGLYFCCIDLRRRLPAQSILWTRECACTAWRRWGIAVGRLLTGELFALFLSSRAAA